MRRQIGIAAVLLLCVGCVRLPDNSISSKGSIQVPGGVKLQYIGDAVAESGDPINGCRVYAYMLEGYYQTAILCRNGTVISGGSSHHQYEDDASAGQAAQ